MLVRKNFLLAFLATLFIACFINACKSVTTRVSASQSRQQKVLAFANAKEDHFRLNADSFFAGQKPAREDKVLVDTTNPGKNISDTVASKFGNALPKVVIHTTDNSTFFFDRPTRFRYTVNVTDSEDKAIDSDNLRVTMKYLPHITPNVSLITGQQIENYNVGRNLVAASDCKTCHQSIGKSPVPSFAQVSEKYWNIKNAISRLADKIITGGSGVWGEQVMSAHPQLSKEEATEIVKYILSVSLEKPDMEIPPEGTEVLNEHIGSGGEGLYIFSASYTNNSSAIPPQTSRDVVVLRPSKVEAERADIIRDMQKQTGVLAHISNQSYFVLANIDLKDVSRLTYCYSSKNYDATIEVHADSLKGQMISTTNYKASGAWEKFLEVSSPITVLDGKHDLYVVFIKNDASNRDLAWLDWINFEGGNEVKSIQKKSPVRTKLAKSGLKRKNAASRRIKAQGKH